MNGKNQALIAGGAALAATAAAAAPNSETLEAVGRWPLVVVLGAVCCFCVWIIYCQGCEFGKRLDKLADAIKELAEKVERAVAHREERDRARGGKGHGEERQ